jgi:uncharacterized membrane protein YidH (DUF202 family)
VGIETQSIDGVFMSSDVGIVLVVMCIIALLYAIYLTALRMSDVKNNVTTQSDLPVVLFHMIILFIFVMVFSTIGDSVLYIAGAAVCFFPIIVDIQYLVPIIENRLK